MVFTPKIANQKHTIKDARNQKTIVYKPEKTERLNHTQYSPTKKKTYRHKTKQ